MVHFVVVYGAMPNTGSHTKSEHGLPPTDRWAVREDKSNNGRIIKDFLQSLREQLGRVASSGSVYHKQPTFEHDQENSI